MEQYGGQCCFGLVILIGLLLFLLGRKRNFYLEGGLSALESDELLFVDKSNSGGYRFKNDRCSIVYFPPEKGMETVDMVAFDYTGGVILTYQNDEPIKWISNGVNINIPLMHGEAFPLDHKVLEYGREAYRRWQKELQVQK